MSELIEREAVQEMMKAEQVELQELSHRRLEYDDAMYASINARIRLIIKLREQIRHLPSALRAAQPLTRDCPTFSKTGKHTRYLAVPYFYPFVTFTCVFCPDCGALLDSLADKGGE